MHIKKITTKNSYITIIMRKMLYFLILIFMAGCNNHNNFVFETKMSLKGDEVKINVVINPTELLIYDSLLLIKERNKSKKCLKIFNLNDFNLISNAVFLGKGPGEVANPASTVIDKDNGILWYSDWGKYKCFKFPIDSLLLNQDFRASESFMIKKGLMPIMNMFYYPPEYFGFSSFSAQKNLISIMDNTGEQIDSLGIPNKLFSDIWKEAGYSDNPFILHYNQDKNKIVVASRFKNLLAVINEKGNLIFQIQGNSIEDNHKKGNTPEKNYRAFYLIDTDDNYIYCLHVGGVYYEYDIKLNRGIINYPSSLLVFNWEGKGIYEIQLDHSLLYFAIDKARKRLIGSTMDFENGLVMYDLKKLYK